MELTGKGGGGNHRLRGLSMSADGGSLGDIRALMGKERDEGRGFKQILMRRGKKKCKR